MINKQRDEDYSPEEAARRRDAVVRRMANTPPQPRVKAPTRHQKKGRQAAENQATRKPDADDKDA